VLLYASPDLAFLSTTPLLDHEITFRNQAVRHHAPGTLKFRHQRNEGAIQQLLLAVEGAGELRRADDRVAHLVDKSVEESFSTAPRGFRPHVANCFLVLGCTHSSLPPGCNVQKFANYR